MTKSFSALVAVAVLTTSLSGARTEKLQGYAEWRKGELIIIDGQRVAAGVSTRFKGDNKISNIGAIPLGYEVTAEGVRRSDGVLQAATIEAKPNGTAMGENEIRAATNDIEAKWVKEGAVYETDAKGERKNIGRTVTSGRDVDRCQAVLKRVIPPYVDPSSVRLHVVETKDWNAMAMGNGSIWVFTGLLHDMNDDEVAIVLSHELVHYTHEHARKGYRQTMITQGILGGVAVATLAVDKDSAKTAVALAGTFSLMAWHNGYSRNMEDQADRVGLRYAYEGGFNVTAGPALWQRFSTKYGEQSSALNFFVGDHSTASARIRNLQREIQLNYSGPRT